MHNFEEFFNDLARSAVARGYHGIGNDYARMVYYLDNGGWRNNILIWDGAFFQGCPDPCGICDVDRFVYAGKWSMK